MAELVEFTISSMAVQVISPDRTSMAPSSHKGHHQERLEGTEPHGSLDWTIAEEMQVGTLGSDFFHWAAFVMGNGSRWTIGKSSVTNSRCGGVGLLEFLEVS